MVTVLPPATRVELPPAGTYVGVSQAYEPSTRSPGSKVSSMTVQSAVSGTRSSAGEKSTVVPPAAGTIHRPESVPEVSQVQAQLPAMPASGSSPPTPVNTLVTLRPPNTRWAELVTVKMAGVCGPPTMAVAGAMTGAFHDQEASTNSASDGAFSVIEHDAVTGMLGPPVTGVSTATSPIPADQVPV